MGTSISATPIGRFSRAWEVYGLEFQRRYARHDAQLFRVFRESAESEGFTLPGSRVLDIGCGYRFPITLLLHSCGARVVGIDVEMVARRLPMAHLGKHLIQKGPIAFTRRLLRETLYKKVYYRTLEREFGAPLRFEGVDIRQSLVEDLVEQAEFDIVFSNAAFEHIMNVEKAVEVIARVLKPGGLAYVSIHLFASLSGGHDLAYSTAGTRLAVLQPGARPWQHLRDPRWVAPTSLNRLREHDYRQIFERHLTIVDWRVEHREPESFLSEEILRELPGYSREELLKRSIVVVARKKP